MLPVIFEGAERHAEALEYQHDPSNVIHLNTPHARAHAIANAAQAALSLEENRGNMERDQQLVMDLRRQRCRCVERIEQIDAMLKELSGE